MEKRYGRNANRTFVRLAPDVGKILFLGTLGRRCISVGQDGTYGFYGRYDFGIVNPGFLGGLGSACSLIVKHLKPVLLKGFLLGAYGLGAGEAYPELTFG